MLEIRENAKPLLEMIAAPLSLRFALNMATSDNQGQELFDLIQSLVIQGMVMTMADRTFCEELVNGIIPAENLATLQATARAGIQKVIAQVTAEGQEDEQHLEG